MTRSTPRSKYQNSQQQLMDIHGLLHNLTSRQLNSDLCTNHDRIHQIIAKGEDGVWAASEKFPRTVLEFVTLDRPDMLALQTFYNIQLGCAKPLFDETSPPRGLDNLLFIEIARTFGLTFWLRDEVTDAFEYQE